MSSQVSTFWSAAAAAVLANAVIRAPSVHNIQPWTVRVAGREAQLWERQDVELPQYDPEGRDRTISCGAALANLELAVRVLGRAATLSMLPDPASPELVATVTAGDRLSPEMTDLHRYSAIDRRRSDRRQFAGTSVSAHDLAEVVRAGTTQDVYALSVRGEFHTDAVADLLTSAAQDSRRDRSAQRELSTWTIRDERARRHGVGIAVSCMPAGELPWAGLVRPATGLPRRDVLRQRMDQERLLIFFTDTDSRVDHLRAGYALESAWLTAVNAGLTASILTQPLHVPHVRAELRKRFALDGYPQVLMRVGHSLGTPAPASLRRSIDEVLQ
ncbi:MAG: nitroreductase [Amycolatopsis sp.]|uniref:Acg family FMN-binding oxidoreductase n=1 Tax=Amycolatopsis sp. TaxID=37632 RepID=UPI002620D304|nr:nitroreductase family protein [Amycolatopsis sp.]MCU1686558.1 nitroreductase [Amycolatopsis sp.]